MNYLGLFLKGIFIGIGSIAPGLSGGVLAMVFGVYEELIAAISHLVTALRTKFAFLATVGFGALVGIVLFGNIQRYLLERYEMQTMAVFTGLIIGTLPQLFKIGNKKGFDQKVLIGFFITFAIGISLALIGENDIDVQNQTVHLNVQTTLLLVLIGFVLAGSVVIPGVSGTVLLMLIGAYGIFINAIANLKDIFFIFTSQEMFRSVVDNLLLVMPLGLGLGFGAIFYSRVMNYFLKFHYSITYYAILGFVVGAIFEIIPPLSFDKAGILSIFLGIVALVVSLHVNKLVKED